ncbi:hypothetical protein FRC20_006102, partial [Serendipita sp. 405]
SDALLSESTQRRRRGVQSSTDPGIPSACPPRRLHSRQASTVRRDDPDDKIGSKTYFVYGKHTALLP